jgi:hypothetical protein
VNVLGRADMVDTIGLPGGLASAKLAVRWRDHGGKDITGD